MAARTKQDESEKVVSTKVPAHILAEYDAAAAAAGMTRHRWMRVVLDAAAGHSDLPQQLMRVVKFQPPKPVRDGKW